MAIYPGRTCSNQELPQPKHAMIIVCAYQGFVSEDVDGFQTFTLDGIPDDLVVSSILILTPGTVEDGDGFDLLGSRIIGEYAPNPTGDFLVSLSALRTE